MIMVTLGTGIGSALFVDGELVPNTELGHLKMGKKDAEQRAADSVREAESLSWKEWAERLDEYLLMVEALFSPDLFIVGGGVSKKSDKFLPAPVDQHRDRARAAAQRSRHRRRRARARAARRRPAHRLTVGPAPRALGRRR